MKIMFEDRSFVEFTKKDGKVAISLGSVKKEDGRNVLSVSSVEVSLAQLQELTAFDSSEKDIPEGNLSSQSQAVTT